ncbi:winged helix-turn-helix domain-containing protein [Streptomyces sp. DT24]|uniref:winged helix-turn-helix domain-containing protein n=1 Tax=unclassified Streptomyces TaxID=2593676 RepID=UPI0023B8BBB4|nr:winged helix-turn-helix domain-containing protein [Streptomyces sp. AM 4-1-1]WEH33045.1 winged helix-turn-helix domain-containing protein [Streptomyces sp. AM 4-1-1]
MANTRTFSASAATTSSAAAASATTARTTSPHRHRLRAVDRDEVVQPVVGVAEFLPPGATWLPAPQHTLPSLPGRPPMIGYLVLVPADQQPFVAAAAAAAGQRFMADAGPGGAGPLGDEPADAPTTDRAAVPAADRVAGGGEARARADGPVVIDASRRTASVDGVTLDLTYLEFELLAHLVAHPHRVHTRDQLVTTVWGYGHVGDGRTVDVHIARLRRKLGADHRRAIQTVRRVGYKYTP